MAMYRAVREKHCRHRLSVAGFATQRYGISPRSEGEALMAMMAKQRQRHAPSWKSKAKHRTAQEKQRDATEKHSLPRI